jgi:hypothetical protein
MLQTNSNGPYVILGTYKPEEGTSCEQIGKFLTEITSGLNLVPFKNKEIKRNKKAAWSDYKLHAEVRKTAVKNSEATSFHQDGDTSTKDMDFAMVVWADRDPTEFKLGEKVYQPKPFELVLARNLGCYHRRPNIEGKRLFFRQRVELPKDINLP